MKLALQSNRSRIALGTLIIASLVIAGSVYVYNGRARIIITSIPASQPAGFCDDDRQIIETVLISLIDAPDFPSNGSNNKTFTSIAIDETSLPTPSIELACNNPGHSLVGESAIDYRSHLIRKYEQTPFTGVPWDSRIKVLGFSKLPKDSIGLASGTAFGQSYPDIRTWIQVSLPFYFNNGSNAYLKISFPNGMHGAGGDFFLVKNSGRWAILWHEFHLYC